VLLLSLVVVGLGLGATTMLALFMLNPFTNNGEDADGEGGNRPPLGVVAIGNN
jgi:hypothetical protein